MATIGITVIGVFAYRNLNGIIDVLEEELTPNQDLVTLHQVSSELRKMEVKLEAFVLSQEEEQKKQFEESTSRILASIDSLKDRNSDPYFLNQADTLSNLVLTKANILMQVAKLDYSSMENQLAQVQVAIDDISLKTIQSTSEDSIQRNKKGFLERIFSKKSPDTTYLNRARNYQKMVNSQLDSMAKLALQKQYKQRLKEYALQQDHQLVQTRISDILESLDAWELSHIRSQSTTAKNQVAYVNRYLVTFGWLAPILLLITVFVLVIYVIQTKKYQHALNSARNSALEVARAKETFLATMSHEIRTPMNAIVGFSKVLLDSPLTPSQREQLSIIDKSADHLLFLVNDILDYSKLQAGKLKLEQVGFQPAVIISEVIQLLEHRAKEKNLIIIHENEIGNLSVLGDPYRLRQVLLNLVYNAIKFTEKGSIVISSRSLTVDQNIQLFVSVTDSGIGIAKAKQKSIFEEFEQVGTGRGGTGLGLAITKKLIELQNGTIKVKSKVRVGSTFSIEIPYASAPEFDTKREQETTNNSSNLNGISVLIADDELYNRKLLETILEKSGAIYDTAIDGDQTLAALESKKYDVVLLDFRMPKISGLDIVERLRKTDSLSDETKIIGLTATVSDEDRKRAHSLGIEWVLKKPFDSVELFSIINENKTVQSDTETSYNLDSLRLMGDENFVNDMISTFIESTTTNLDLFQAAVDKEEWPSAGEILHKIIAPSRHFKAVDLVANLKKWELEALAGNPIPKEAVDKMLEEIQSLVSALELHLQEATSHE